MQRYTKIYTGPVAFILSLISSGYWIFGSVFNVYTYALVGALYELLWVFMILLLFLVPFASLIGIIMNKFKEGSLYLGSILLNIGTFLWLYFFI